MKITYNSLENARQESTIELTTELDPYKGQSGLVSILHDHQPGELSQNQVWYWVVFPILTSPNDNVDENSDMHGIREFFEVYSVSFIYF